MHRIATRRFDCRRAAETIDGCDREFPSRTHGSVVAGANSKLRETTGDSKSDFRSRDRLAQCARIFPGTGVPAHPERRTSLERHVPRESSKGPASIWGEVRHQTSVPPDALWWSRW